MKERDKAKMIDELLGHLSASVEDICKKDEMIVRYITESIKTIRVINESKTTWL